MNKLTRVSCKLSLSDETLRWLDAMVDPLQEPSLNKRIATILNTLSEEVSIDVIELIESKQTGLN